MNNYKIYFKQILSPLLLGSASAQCKQCLQNSILCVNQTSFAYCFGDMISNEVNKCPGDFVCTDKQAICLPESKATPAACIPSEEAEKNDCSKCTKNWRINFACIKENTFVPCDFEGNPKFSEAHSCPKGYVCNIDSEDICVTNAKPSCYATQ